MSEAETEIDNAAEAAARLKAGRQLIGGKWGRAVSGGDTGYQAVPDVLLRGQRELGVTEVEMVVLLNVTMHWWRADELPFMRVSTIAKRMGKSERSVQRALSSLIRKGILMREKTWPGPGEPIEKRRRKFNPAPLVEKLCAIADRIEFDNSERQQEPG